MFFLVPNIMTNLILITSDGTDTVAACPKASPKQVSSTLLDFSMNTNRTFSLQEPDDHCYTKSRWHAKEHVNVIRAKMPFHESHALLPTQVSKDIANLIPYLSVKNLFAIFRHNHNMIQTLPFYVGLTLPFFHRVFSLAPRGLPQGDSLS